MTIGNLIEKLKKENERQMNQGEKPNGAYGILESWFSELTELDPQKKETEKFEYYYNSIRGMSWGLKAAFFITADEQYQIQVELDQIFKRFYKYEEE